MAPSEGQNLEDINVTLQEIERLVPEPESPEDDQPFCLKDGEKALQFPYEKCSGCPAYSFCHDWHITYFGALQQNFSDLGFSVEPEITELFEISDPLSYLLEDLEHRVKRDKVVKLSVFFTALSAYLSEPINLFVRGESSSGKSYNVTQVLKYFPKEDVWLLGGLSPTALVHEKGEYMDDAVYINLSHKILVFLEAPNYETFRRLYPILSHDAQEIEYKFTDKSAKGRLQTSKVVIAGWPASIFCTTSNKYMEELSTRSLSVTPETSTEKIHDALQLKNSKAAFPWLMQKERKETQVIRTLVSAVKEFFAKADIVVPHTGLKSIFSVQLPRDMRDFDHFIAMLKAITAFHMFQRPLIQVDGQMYVLAQYEDVKNVCDIFENIVETTKTGMEAKLLQFYHNIVEQKEAWFISDLVAEYNKQSVKKVSRDTMQKWLERLSDIGYVTSEDDPNDRRVRVYKPLVKSGNSLENLRYSPIRRLSGSDWLKGLESWLENIRQQDSFYIREKVYMKWKEIKSSELVNYLNHVEIEK